MTTPAERIRALNARELRSDGAFVLYWMTAHRRTRFNWALQHAIERARELDRPLVVLEALRVGYRWASDRFHVFVLEGMAENKAALEKAGVSHLAYLEPEEGAGRGLLQSLASRASLVVTDDFPSFFLPGMQAAAAKKVAVRMEAVDTNGLLPIHEPARPFVTAYSFRAYYQKNLRAHFALAPKATPLSRHGLPKSGPDLDELIADWPMLDAEALSRPRELAAALPIDHEVRAVATRGGMKAAAEALDRLVAKVLPRYDEDRNHPDEEATSGLSPYLHFGHVSAHEIFARLHEPEGFDLGRLAEKTRGARQGFWGLDAAREGFLDQLVTWRELCYRTAAHEPGFDRFDSLPDFALKTLMEHEDDPRDPLYSPEVMEAAETHDEVWNAAQRELVTTGRMHNYLRMLWGKKILEWSKSPRAALDLMIHLNNRYALDGRNPNSYGGIFWVLGRYDRAWGPERPIFGKIRYMSSDNTKRKVRLKAYLERFAGSSQGELFGD